MGEACDLHWKRREMRKAVWWGNATEGDLLEDLGVNGRITKCFLKREGVDWIYLAGDRETRQAFFNTVKNLWYSLKCGWFTTWHAGLSRRTLLHVVSFLWAWRQSWARPGTARSTNRYDQKCTSKFRMRCNGYITAASCALASLRNACLLNHSSIYLSVCM